jgi:DNA adenine methylase
MTAVVPTPKAACPVLAMKAFREKYLEKVGTEKRQEARPFLKSVGGKTRLLEELIRLMPDAWLNYHEPFFGGGALFFELASGGYLANKVFLSDLNEDFIAAYVGITNNVEAVIRFLRLQTNDEDYFYKMRARQPEGDVDRAVRTIYLNKTCFNGLWRTNKKGEFNTPFGKYTNPTICDESNLRAVSRLLGDLQVTISVADFETALSWTKRGDFAYLDPPYVPVSKTASFTAYQGGFGEKDQVRLADAYRKHAARGVKLMLSNSDTPLVHELYSGFDIQVVQAPRAVNSKGSGRGKVNELLVRSWIKP